MPMTSAGPNGPRNRFSRPMVSIAGRRLSARLLPGALSGWWGRKSAGESTHGRMGGLDRAAETWLAMPALSRSPLGVPPAKVRHLMARGWGIKTPVFGASIRCRWSSAHPYLHGWDPKSEIEGPVATRGCENFRTGHPVAALVSA